MTVLGQARDPQVQDKRPREPPGTDVLIVVNPGMTRYPPEKVLAALEGALGKAGLRYRIFEIPREGEVRPAVLREVARALEEDCDRVLAVGGDGTVSMVAEGMARSEGPCASAALGIIPAGTANVLARELGIPVSLEAAIANAIETRQSLTLDAIQVGNRFLLTQIGIGPDAQMIRDTSRESQARLGRMAYVGNFLRRSFRQRSRRFHLSLDGHTLHARAWEILVANVGSMGSPPFTWGPRIDPTDRVLDLCIYDVRSPADYVRLAWRLLVGRHRRDESTRFFRVRESVVIESDRPALVQGDGEVLGTTPVTVRIVPEAVRVLVHREVEQKEAEPSVTAATAEAGAGNGDSVSGDVEKMLAQHSRTWVLQGWLKHPVAALEALDAALFLRANALSLGSAVDRGARILSDTMRHGEAWGVILLAMIAVDASSGLRVAAEAVPVIGLTMLTVNYPLKSFFRRRRPFLAFVKARVVGTRPRDFSFPSGHAAAGFAGALILGAHAPAFAPLFYALAVLVSLSRVYLGVHYLSDITFGAFLGASIAAIYRGIFFWVLNG